VNFTKAGEYFEKTQTNANFIAAMKNVSAAMTSASSKIQSPFFILLKRVSM
jgi:hypothetical protein